MDLFFPWISWFRSCFLSGHVHITDFNIATELHDGQLATSLSGTKPYMGQCSLLLHPLLLPLACHASTASQRLEETSSGLCFLNRLDMECSNSIWLLSLLMSSIHSTFFSNLFSFSHLFLPISFHFHSVSFVLADYNLCMAYIIIFRMGVGGGKGGQEGQEQL